MTRFNVKIAGALAVALALSALAIQPADARRGGSFGSRGSRTYYAPAPTGYSPGYVAPIQRSMTTRPVTAQAPAYASQPFQPQPFQRQPGSRFGGFGGGLVGGLLAGGLIGGLMGHGMGYGGGMGGGGGGMLMALIQLALLGGIIWFVVGLFRRNSGNRPANGPANGWSAASSPTPPFAMGYREPVAPQPYPSAAPEMASIAITGADKAAFEQLLIEIQDAFGHEDYARLRERTTPEVMSYLAEELSQNATNGLRNEVTATRLLDAQVSEAWNEDAADYATIAMHYESIDVMHDRQTGAIVKGDPGRPTQTTELWTFVRDGYGPWKLSAIQET
jgi:predicted lipid-binding transport protein (Tim44 family)